MRRIMIRTGITALGALILALGTPSWAFGGGRVRLHFGFGPSFPHHRLHHPKFVFPHKHFHHPHAFFRHKHFRQPRGFSRHFRIGPQFHHHHRHHPRAFGSPFVPHHRR